MNRKVDLSEVERSRALFCVMGEIEREQNGRKNGNGTKGEQKRNGNGRSVEWAFMGRFFDAYCTQCITKYFQVAG